MTDPANSLAVADRDAIEARAARDQQPIVMPWRPELAILRRAFRPNVLLIGNPHVSGVAIAELLPYLPRPVVMWDAGIGTEGLSIAQGTLVILNLERLGGAEQRQLLEFTDARPRTVQIISVATTDMFERVERGEFLDALYYRLNTVRLHVRD